ATQVGQLKALVDVCHAYGLAVVFDVVYNHAGGDFGGGQDTAESLYFLDRADLGSNNDSLYFTDQGGAAGLVFAFYDVGHFMPRVRRLLIDNAAFWLAEAHVDGLRYDEVTVIDGHGGWHFCQDLTDAVRSAKPQAPQIAEYWQADQSWVVRPRSSGGA